MRYTAHAGLLILLLLWTSAWAASAGEGNRQGSGRHTAGCGKELALYQNNQELWRRDASQVAAMPGSRLLNEGRKNAAKGIELGLLLPADEPVQSIEILTCKGKTKTLTLADLYQQKLRYYLVPNRQGAFKLVALHRQGKKESLLKEVRRIVLHSAAPDEK